MKHLLFLAGVVAFGATGCPAPRIAMPSPGAPAAMTHCAPLTSFSAPKVPPRQVIASQHAQWISNLRFSPDRRLLASDSSDGGFATGETRVWDVEHRSGLVSFDKRPAFNWEDDGRFVYGDSVLDFNTGATSPLAGRQIGIARAAGITPVVWVVDGDTAAKVVDGKGATVALLPYPVPSTAAAPQLADVRGISRDARVVVGIADDKIAEWTRAADGTFSRPKVRADLPAPMEKGNVVLAPSGDRIAYVDGAGRFVIASVGGATGRAPTLAFPKDWTANDTTVTPIGDTRLAISPKGFLAVAALGGVAVFDIATGALRWSRKTTKARSKPPSTLAEILLDNPITAVALSDDGALVATGTARGEITLYDGASGRLQGPFGHAPARAESVVFVSESALAVAAIDHVTTWSLDGGRVTAQAPSAKVAKVGVTAKNDVVAVRLPPDLPLANPCGTRWPLYVDRWTGLKVATIPSAKPICLENKLDGVLYKKVELRSLSAVGERAVLRFTGATAGGDERSFVDVIDLVAGERIALDKRPARDAVLSPNGQWLVNQQCRAVDDTGAEITGDEFERDAFRAEATGGTPKYAKYRSECAVHVWDARTGHHVREAAIPRIAEHMSVSDAEVATGNLGHVTIRKLADLGAATSFEVDDSFEAFQLAGEGRLLVGMIRGGELRVYRDGKISARIAAGGRRVKIAASPSGRLAALINDDGASPVVRLWDLETGTLRATLADFEDDEWAITSPGGAFTGTSEVGTRVGYVFEKPLEHFGFEQFATVFRRPDIIARRLKGEGADIDGVVTRPPVVSIVSSTVHGATAKVCVRATSEVRVDTIRAFVEGRPVASANVCEVAGEVTLDVPLGPGPNRVSVVATDARGFAANVATVDVVGPKGGKAPDVWVVAVGVGRYPRLPASMQLPAAVNDARAIADAFTERAGPGRMYSTAHVKVLVDDDKPTATSILAALATLEKMAPEDVAVVLLAGHGFKPSDSADMVFVTGGAELSKGGLTAASLANDAVGWKQIGAALTRAKGRTLVLLDACHAGHVSQDEIVPNNALAESLVTEQRAGVFVFAAAKGRQQSLEPFSARGLELTTATKHDVLSNEAKPHGFFTGAFLASLDDARTDRNTDHVIQLSEIVDDVTRRVTTASGGTQTPWVARRELFGDFAVSPAK